MTEAGKEHGVAPLTLFVPMFEDFEPSGRDAENHWYDTDHVPQRLTVPGFHAAARYQRCEVYPLGMPAAPLRYLNVYVIDRPGVVASEAYAASFGHVTPRTALETFVPSVPRYRDVWQQAPSPWEGTRLLRMTGYGPHTVLVAASDTTDVAAGAAFLDETAIPAMLSCPGVLRGRRFERVDVPVAAQSAAHAPRFMTVLTLAGAEAVTRADFAAAIRYVEQRASAAGDRVQTAWAGVYMQRPSPWTVHVVESEP